jgi:glycosyltransferase involved in cell wall biosynthesis
MRTVAAACDAVVTTDRALVPVVERYLGIPPVDQVVIPNAVDPDACRRQGDRRRGVELLEGLGLGGATPVLLSVGRIESNKGFDVLVSALALAAPDLPTSWAWVLVGDGPERASVERSITQAGLRGRAVLAGRLADGDLHGLYDAADWFVHPTRYEGISGFLVAPGNAEALAAGLRETSIVDGRALGDAGRSICETRFSWAAVVPEYLALYQRLARARAKKPDVT